MSSDFPDCPGGTPPAARPLLTVACALLVDPQGQVLVATRPPGKAMAGLWEFPGGKVEPLESPEAALVRELAEELGIETATSCLAPCGFASQADGDIHLLLLAFAIRKWQGRPTPHDGQQLAWHAVNTLFRLPMPPADKALLGQVVELI